MKATIKSIIIAGGLLASSANASLITNGGFESDVGLSGTQWGVFNTIDGWYTSDGAGIEIQRNTVTSAQEGNQYVELDSHHAGSNSSMSQDLVGLSVGQVYKLDFWYKARTGSTNDNGINVSWGASPDLSPFTYAFNVDGVAPMDWTLVTGFLTATAADMTLTFSATGKENTLGGFIDNISLASYSVPEPGSLALLALGLAGFGVSRGRKK
ncbi:PEP-CTERM sorting domain-containing protein [Alkalimarinus coralli]|uniref:PEP-CTERM sorting domain-containing protein n=1 Tax=Alkalimarinus coralli TaxID=2935863 RepID=UPI00202AFBAB|nr:PEP-CTERM sorting domain-containing protein [Alkalimarinus coralli]